jgi:hypothetical protein
MRPRTRFFLGSLLMLLVAGAAAGFLFLQLAPACSERLPKAQKAVFCVCSGMEYTRVNNKQTGYLNTVCLGQRTDLYTNFIFWNERELTRSDRVTVELGLQKLVESSDAPVIRKIGTVFEKLKQGWRMGSRGTASPQMRVVFSNFSVAPGGASTIRHDTWFAVGEDFIEIDGGLRRLLTPEEKALVQSVTR